MLRHHLSLPCYLLLGGCAATDDTALLPGGAPDSGDPRVLFDTVVRVSPDGALTEFTQPVSVEERAAQLDARREQLEAAERGAARDTNKPAATTLGQSRAELSVNPACAVSDLWLYDADLSHRLCISGADLSVNEIDYLDLEDATYCRPGGISDRICLSRVSWEGKVAYIYPGAYNGRLIASSDWVLLGASMPFDAWGPFEAIDPVYSSLVELHGYFLH